MDSIHESRIVFHFWGHGAKQVPQALLMLDIYIKVANHDDTAIGPNALLATAELSRFHIAFHDVHAVFLVKRDAGHLVKTDHIILAD